VTKLCTGVKLHGKIIPDSQQFQHDEIITSPEEPSVLVNLMYTFFDVEIVHEGFATSEFFVLGMLQQPQNMKFSESPDLIPAQILQKNGWSPNILAGIFFYLRHKIANFSIICSGDPF
jgi:hypothetical protein